MVLTCILVSALASARPDTTPAARDTTPAVAAGPLAQPAGIGAAPPADDTTPPRRRKAVQISDAYATRLRIHYAASYAMLPLFAGQAVVGEQLFHSEQNGYPPSRAMRETHDAIAIALGALFLTNTVTGSLNWWETRRQDKGRAWRTVHAALMLLSDAGMAYTAALGERGAFTKAGGNPARDVHRNWAEATAGVALVSYAMMWKPFRHD